MKNKINIIIFLLIIFSFFIILFFKKDTIISQDERRYLTTKKELKIDENFSTNLEKYLLDQFPMRNEFRKIKSICAYKIFNKLENNEILSYNNSLIKIDDSYKLSNVETTIDKINALRKNMFRRNKVYFCLIPDKGEFYNLYSSMTPNYDEVKNIIKDNMSVTTFIDIRDYLSLSDYYKTDTHWSQNNIKDVSKVILETMKNEYEDIEYTIKEIDNFKGVLLSWAYLPGQIDTIKYLTNDEIENCKVFNYETNKESKVYDLDKLYDEKSLDNYDIFLSGASSLLKITNENAISDKTLIIFRDSFGSSITPLFIHNYKEIYVVDLRYIDSSLIPNFIDISGDEDVLFLYSMTLVGIPGNFKINLK